eukprot:49308-Eustigmatos_ZCMA.PRE.1
MARAVVAVKSAGGCSVRSSYGITLGRGKLIIAIGSLPFYLAFLAPQALYGAQEGGTNPSMDLTRGRW